MTYRWDFDREPTAAERAAIDASDRHIAEHGCGDPERYNADRTIPRGVGHCKEGMRLFVAIPYELRPTIVG